MLSWFWRFSTYFHDWHSFAYKKPMWFTYHTWNSKSFGFPTKLFSLWWSKWKWFIFHFKQARPNVLSPILPVYSSMTCKFCRTEKESINHLLLECNGLLNVREMTDELLRSANSSFKKTRILQRENISSIPEAIVISKYKETIWNVQNTLIRGAKHNEERTAEKVRKSIDSHLRKMQAAIK